jgi:hypothetical protein
MIQGSVASIIACLLLFSSPSQAALTTSNDQIIFNGSPVNLKVNGYFNSSDNSELTFQHLTQGANWFGFNNG